MCAGDVIAWGERIMRRTNGLRAALLIACATAALAPNAAIAAPPANAASAEQRAAEAVSKMTLDEKLQLVFGYFASD